MYVCIISMYVCIINLLKNSFFFSKINCKVWGLVRTTRQYLRKGYSTVTLRDGDFYFCYFLWFENENVS